MSIVMRSAVIRMPFDLAMSSDLSRRQYHERAKAVLADLERLEEEYNDLRERYDDLVQECMVMGERT